MAAEGVGMRALRVLGIAENGAQVVCQPVADDQTPVSAVETFTLPVDERLRAAVRGDLTRIGQLEIEMESQLRPREIQQRIRAGSTVEQVAAAAGCSPERIERYAYPVLLERSTIAEKARLAHPVIDGVTASRAVQDVVADTLAARGQQATVTWDAFRDERGWALRAGWKVGRSENRATWSYHAGPAGGTVIARDEAASMLIDPAQRPLRGVGTESRAPVPSGNKTAVVPAPQAATIDVLSGHDAAAPSSTIAPPTVDEPAPAPSVAPTTGTDHARAEALEEQRRLVANTVVDARSGSRPAATRAAAEAALGLGEAERTDGAPEAGRARDTGTDGPSVTPGAGHPAARPAPARSKRGQRPQMPSWEDVLLGTRTGH